MIDHGTVFRHCEVCAQTIWAGSKCRDCAEDARRAAPRFRVGDRVAHRDGWTGTVDFVAGRLASVKRDDGNGTYGDYQPSTVLTDLTHLPAPPAEVAPVLPVRADPTLPPDEARIESGPHTMRVTNLARVIPDHPHACLRCGAPAYQGLVTAECSRGAECGVEREVEIVVEPIARCACGAVSRSTSLAHFARTGAASAHRVEQGFRAMAGDHCAEAATREAAVEAVRRRLRGEGA